MLSSQESLRGSSLTSQETIEYVGVLFMMDMSPPCRAVLLTVKALGIVVRKKRISLAKGENKTPEFLKMNPAHSIPTYKDNDGTIIGDSHAIMIFLVDKYGGHLALYPFDYKKRAVINQMLHFDSGSVFSLYSSILNSILYQHEKGPTAQQIVQVDSVYETLDLFLENQKWVVPGDHYTLADFSLSTSILALKQLVPLDWTMYENITDWILRCEQIPFYDEVNSKGQEMFEAMLKDHLRNLEQQNQET